MREDFYYIDRAGTADLDAIMGLERDGFPDGIVEDETVFVARMKTFAPGFVLLRERSTDRALGYLCAERWADKPELDKSGYRLGHDPAPRHDPRGKVLYLASMTIAPDHRGTGLGSILFDEGRKRIKADAPGIEEEVLIVHEAWTGARKIYREAGFADVGAIEGFFAARGAVPRAAIVMRRNASEG